MSQFEENRHIHPDKNSSKKTLRVDLTPMVDLGFLLITFFILTTTFSQPTVAKLIMPKDSPVKTEIKNSAVLTLLLTRNDSLDYYEGKMPDPSLIKHCSFSGLRSVIQQKQVEVAKILGDSTEMVLIISPGKESTYKNFVDALDEIEINDIQHYFIVDVDQ